MFMTEHQAKNARIVSNSMVPPFKFESAIRPINRNPRCNIYIDEGHIKLRLERFGQKQSTAAGLDVDRPRKSGSLIDALGPVIVLLYFQRDFATPRIACFLLNGG